MKKRKANVPYFLVGSTLSIIATYFLIPDIEQYHQQYTGGGINFIETILLDFVVWLLLIANIMILLVKATSAYEGVLAILQTTGYVCIVDDTEPGEEHTT